MLVVLGLLAALAIFITVRQITEDSDLTVSVSAEIAMVGLGPVAGAALLVGGSDAVAKHRR